MQSPTKTPKNFIRIATDIHSGAKKTFTVGVVEIKVIWGKSKPISVFLSRPALPHLHVSIQIAHLVTRTNRPFQKLQKQKKTKQKKQKHWCL